jgi:hypothetical protein
MPKEIYKIDHILEICSHAVVRLPPYICHLNPVEFAWTKIKRNVCEDNITGDPSLQELLQVIKYAVALVTKEDWEGFSDNRNSWKAKRWVVPEVRDHIGINLNPGSDSDSD